MGAYSSTDFLPHRAGPGVGGGVTGSADSSLTVAGADAIINRATAGAWTAAHTFTAATVPITSTITDGSANVKIEAARLRHQASVTATAGIGAYASFWTSNGVAGGGTLAEAGRIVGFLRTVTNAAESGVILFATNEAGTLSTTASANVGWISNGRFGSNGYFIGTISALGVVTANCSLLTASSMFNLQNNAATLGGFLFTGTANTTGALAYFVITPSSNTGITAATAVKFFDYQAHTATWASNTNVAQQTEFNIAAPTYAFTSATGTIADSATLYISGAPIQGANASLTRSYAIWTDDGDVRHDGIGVALGAGAAATLGTIGAPGPATATQNKWARINIDGTFYFVPVWL